MNTKKSKKYYKNKKTNNTNSKKIKKNNSKKGGGITTSINLKNENNSGTKRRKKRTKQKTGIKVNGVKSNNSMNNKKLTNNCKTVGECYVCNEKKCDFINTSIHNYQYIQDNHIIYDPDSVVNKFIFVSCWGYGCQDGSSQQKVFDAISQKKQTNDFLILGGDNFYMNKGGITNFKEGDYKKFIEDNLQCLNKRFQEGNNIPVFVATGNKEYEFECDHLHYLSNKTMENKAPWVNWVMPHRYFGIVKNNVAIAIIDTNIYAYYEPYIKEKRGKKKCSDFMKYYQEKDRDKLEGVLREQEMWLDNFLRTYSLKENGEMRKTIVVGHHPICAIFHKTDEGGYIKEHMTIMELNKSILPLLMKHKVSMYLCGHEHNLQQHSIKSLTQDGKVEHELKIYVAGGGGAELDTKDPKQAENYQYRLDTYQYDLGNRINKHGYLQVDVENTENTFLNPVETNDIVSNVVL